MEDTKNLSLDKVYDKDQLSEDSISYLNDTNPKSKQDIESTTSSSYEKSKAVLADVESDLDTTNSKFLADSSIIGISKNDTDETGNSGLEALNQHKKYDEEPEENQDDKLPPIGPIAIVSLQMVSYNAYRNICK